MNPVENSKNARFSYALLIVLSAFGLFYIDILTQDMIAFDLFYFPAVMLMAWFCGGIAGVLMAILTGTMWFVAQAEVMSWRGGTNR